jgi:hypothetical protein
LWEPRTGKLLRHLLPAEEEVLSLAFSPDGRTLAVGSFVSAGRNEPMKSKLRLWELATGQERYLFKGKHIGVWSVAFWPDGRTLLSTGGYGIFWDVPTGKELRRFEGHDGGVGAVAVSPTGDTLATAGWDTTVLIWDVADLVHRRQPEAAKLSSKELDALWTDLAGSDADKAGQAIWHLTAAPEQTVPFFKVHVQPVQSADPKRLAALLGDLDSNQFAVREKASQELEKLGDAAEPALRRALADKRSPEARRRMEQILAKLAMPSGDRLRGLRAVEVLEHIATAEARQLLEQMATGIPDAPLTQEAKAALDRLSRRRANRP